MSKSNWVTNKPLDILKKGTDTIKRDDDKKGTKKDTKKDK